MITVIEYLRDNVQYIKKDIPIELKDIIDNRSVYCGYYDIVIKELSKSGLEHVKNARYIDDIYIEDDCYKIYYMKDTKEYSDFDLTCLMEKLKGVD